MLLKRATGLAVLACSIMALTACDKKPTTDTQNTGASAPVAASGPETIYIGFAAPLTGPQAHYGEDYKNGVQLAIDDINQTSPVIQGKPVKFELVPEDDQADPKIATQLAQKLVDKGVSGVIGHFNSGTSIPASQVYSTAGIPMIAMATSPVFTNQGYKNTFRSMTSDTQQGAVLGQFVVNDLKAKKIAIIDDRTAYGQGLADEFEKAVKQAGATVVKREFTNDKATDFAAILTSIKQTKPDLIFYGGADAQSAPMVKQMKRLGITAPLASGEMTKTPTFLKLAGKEGDGTIASLAGVPLDSMPKGPAYEKTYKDRYQSDVATYSPYGYDATRVMVAAMQAANSTKPANYLPVLAKIEYKDAVTTPNWSYDAKGDLKNGGITVYKVENGEWKVLKTIK